MNQDILRTCKDFTSANDLEGLHGYYRELMITEFPEEPDWSWIFKKVYLHACVKGRKEVAQWLCSALLPLLNPGSQLLIRQTITYGKYLLARKAS